MYESYREQRPLLSEDISDEEFKIQRSSPQYHRRLRHSAYSGRATAQAKGAVTVITRWPDHLSTLLAYWWAGLGMIALTIFIIYNSLSIIKTDAFATAVHAPETRYKEKNFRNTSTINVEFLNMFMHIFIEENEEILTDRFLPYIKTIAKKYSSFKYNFIVVVNDQTANSDEEINDKRNNEIAFNSLWLDKNKFGKKQLIENISIQYISVTNFLDESPLGTYWRRLPKQFIEFLVRCLAIWEKGGVAFNPEMLTEKSLDSIYMEKLLRILKKYTKHAKQKNMDKELRKHNSMKKNLKHPVNNIRDIINNLNNEDFEQNIEQLNLTEAENREQTYLNNKKIKRDALPNNTMIINETDVQIINGKYKNNKYSDEEIRKIFEINSKNNKFEPFPMYYAKTAEINVSSTDENITKSKLLPMFLKHFFHDEAKKLKPPIDIQSSNKNILSTSSKSQEINDEIENNQYEMTTKIYPWTTIINPIKTDDISKGENVYDQNTEITIDIKGNLIATKASCHAFIGSILSNIKHNSNGETLTDFIIAELSLFCKGLLSTCKGIDIILL